MYQRGCHREDLIHYVFSVVSPKTEQLTGLKHILNSVQQRKLGGPVIDRHSKTLYLKLVNSTRPGKNVINSGTNDRGKHFDLSRISAKLREPFPWSDDPTKTVLRSGLITTKLWSLNNISHAINLVIHLSLTLSWLKWGGGSPWEQGRQVSSSGD